MFKAKTRFDAAIVVRQWGFGIHFAQIPDAEIAAQVLALTNHPGIILDDEPRDSTGYVLKASEISPTHKEEGQRFYYWLKVSPVFDVLGLARSFSNYLEENHDFRMRLINEIPPGTYEIEESFILIEP